MRTEKSSNSAILNSARRLARYRFQTPTALCFTASRMLTESVKVTNIGQPFTFWNFSFKRIHVWPSISHTFGYLPLFHSVWKPVVPLQEENRRFNKGKRMVQLEGVYCRRRTERIFRFLRNSMSLQVREQWRRCCFWISVIYAFWNLELKNTVTVKPLPVSSVSYIRLACWLTHVQPPCLDLITTAFYLTAAPALYQVKVGLQYFVHYSLWFKWKFFTFNSNKFVEEHSLSSTLLAAKVII